MANSELKIKATLDISDAQRKFKELDEASRSTAQDIQRDLVGAVKKSTAETEKLSAAMEETGQRARMSAEQIGGMAIAMGGLALNLASEVARNQGHDDTADYLGGIGGGVMAGATAGMAAGPWGAVIGGVAGGVMGGMGTYLQHDRRDREAAEAAEEAARKQEAAIRALIQATGSSVEKFDKLRAAAKESASFMERMGDETRSVSSRQAELTARMAQFKAEEARLRDQLADPAIAGDAAAARDAFAALTRNLAEQDRMEAVDIKAKDPTKAGDKPVDQIEAVQREAVNTDALQRLGINLGGGNDYARDQLRVAEDQLAELRKLNDKEDQEDIVVWGA